MKKNDNYYITPATEGYRTYGHDGFISKAVSNTQRPPPPKPLPSAYKSTTFLSMIGKVAGTAAAVAAGAPLVTAAAAAAAAKEMTKNTSSVKTSECHQQNK